MIEDVYWNDPDFREALISRASTLNIRGHHYAVVRNSDDIALAMGPRLGCEIMAQVFRSLGVECRVMNESQNGYHWRRSDGQKVRNKERA